MAGKVGAPFGNKNAQIWTLEKASELLDKALKLADEKELIEKIVGKEVIHFEAYKYDFIGEISCELDVYRDLITRDIPIQHPELKNTVNKLVNKLERNCYSNVKKENINVAVGIVNLKSNHGWTDRQHIEQKQTNIDLSGLTTDEIKNLLNE
jgi:hypothetical protein